MQICWAKVSVLKSPLPLMAWKLDDNYKLQFLHRKKNIWLKYIQALFIFSVTYLYFHFVISKGIKLPFLHSNAVLFKDLHHDNLLFKKWQDQDDIRCIWSKGVTQKEPWSASTLARHHKRLTPHLVGLKTHQNAKLQIKNKHPALEEKSDFKKFGDLPKVKYKMY